MLFVRNLMFSTTEDTLGKLFSTYGRIEKVKKLKDFAFIHFHERGDAIQALNALNGNISQRLFPFVCRLVFLAISSCKRLRCLVLFTETILENALIEVHLAKPPPPAKTASPVLVVQHMFHHDRPPKNAPTYFGYRPPSSAPSANMLVSKGRNALWDNLTKKPTAPPNCCPSNYISHTSNNFRSTNASNIFQSITNSTSSLPSTVPQAGKSALLQQLSSSLDIDPVVLHMVHPQQHQQPWQSNPAAAHLLPIIPATAAIETPQLPSSSSIMTNHAFDIQYRQQMPLDPPDYWSTTPTTHHQFIASTAGHLLNIPLPNCTNKFPTSAHTMIFPDCSANNTADGSIDRPLFSSFPATCSNTQLPTTVQQQQLLAQQYALHLALLTNAAAAAAAQFSWQQVVSEQQQQVTRYPLNPGGRRFGTNNKNYQPKHYSETGRSNFTRRNATGQPVWCAAVSLNLNNHKRPPPPNHSNAKYSASNFVTATKDHADEYQKHRSDTVEQLENELQKLLSSSGFDSQPIIRVDDVKLSPAVIDRDSSATAESVMYRCEILLPASTSISKLGLASDNADSKFAVNGGEQGRGTGKVLHCKPPSLFPSVVEAKIEALKFVILNWKYVMKVKAGTNQETTNNVLEGK